MHRGCGFEEYLKIAARCRVTVRGFKGEAFGIGVLEAAYAGCIPVLVNGGTYRSIMPKDYPFFYDSKKEAVEKIKLIMTSDNIYEKWVKTLREHIDENFDLINVKKKLHEHLERFMITSAIEEKNAFIVESLDMIREKKRFVDDVLKLANSRNSWVFSELYKDILKTSGGAMVVMGRTSVSARDICNVLRKAGFREGNEPDPVFTKVVRRS